jgi:drug/metabolite transporter (DMT)-like permease
MATFLTALLSIVISVAAQFSLKAGMSSAAVKAAMVTPLLPRSMLTVFLNPFVAGGFVLYALGAVIWLGVLAKWDVSKAYPLVGLGFLLTLAVGAALGETVTVLRALGVVLIVGGVWLVVKT